MFNSRWKPLIALLILLLFAGGCIDMEIDLTINEDSTGKAKVAVTASEPYYNMVVVAFVEDTRQVRPEAKIKEGYKELNKTATVEFSFNDVSELAEHGFDITYSQDDQFSYIQIKEIQDVPVEITLNMPGRIVASNGKHSGSRVTWEKVYMNEPYWAESEKGEAGNLSTVFLIAILVVLIPALLLFFWRREGKVVSGNMENKKSGGYCRNCGVEVAQIERYCANCGHAQEVSEGLKQSYGGFSKRAFPVLPLVIVFLFIVGIAAVLIIINTSDEDPVAKRTDGTSKVANELGADYLGYDENKENNSILEMEESVPDGITESESEDEKLMSDDSAEPEAEDEEPSIEYGTISWNGGTYNGMLKDGIPHGYGSWGDPTGKTYVGDFVEGKMTGHGTMVFPGGEKYVGYFLNGKGHGQGVMTHSDGRSVSGTWINGEYQGN